jgi:RNA ligase (TIGR02306 family)
MSEWQALVVRLGKIGTLPNSDFLEITTVMNEYPVILRKGSYKEGDLVSFIGYDSVVPDSEMFNFLAPPPKKDKNGNITEPSPPVGQVKERYRTIKAKKIRGVYSEGLIVDAPTGFQEGDSVIEYFGLTKRIYEEELPEAEKGSNENEVSPRTFSLSKYDLEGLAKYGYVFEEGEPVFIHEKCEGENCSITYYEDKLWVKSRNYFKREADDSHWWEVPHRLDLVNKLNQFPGLTFYGELYGNVKHFIYDCFVVDNKIQRKFRVFDIWEIAKNRFLDWEKVEEICKQVGLETVPLLYHGPWKTDRSLHELAEGKSTIGTCVKEGWVMRSEKESIHPKLGRKIIKLKGRDYKLFKG